MSKYEIDELIKQWALSKMTHEQAIGQLLVHVKSLTADVKALKRQESAPLNQLQTIIETAELETEKS